MKSRSEERGVGLVEVLIGALILAFAVTGTAVLLGDWVPTVNDSSNRTQAINRNTSVMEIARFSPDQAAIVGEVATMEMNSPATTFTITNVSVVDNDGADDVSAKVVWTDPYLTSDNKERSFTLSTSVPDDDEYLGLADLVSNVPQITVSTNAGSGTVISPSSQEVLYGSSVEFDVNLQLGYYDLVVFGCNGTLSGSVYTTGTIVSNCTVESSATLDTTDTDGDGVYDWQDVCPGQDDNSSECQFTPSYVVTPTAEPGTSISPTSDPGSGSAVRTFTVGLTTGYQNLSVDGCGGTLSGNTYTTGVINQDCTVTVTADPLVYAVTTSAGSGSTFSPETAQVPYGGSRQFTVSVDADYVLTGVSGCSGQLNGSVYTTGVITSDCNITSTTELAAQDWSGSVNISQAHYGGSRNKFTVNVTFNPGNVASCSRVNSSGNFSCGFTTDATSVTATISVQTGGGSGNATICSVSPTSAMLDSENSSVSVSLITAKTSSDCPP